jgi:peptidoglycan hydrolase-like protein with peptidoglycan-binding domain
MLSIQKNTKVFLALAFMFTFSYNATFAFFEYSMENLAKLKPGMKNQVVKDFKTNLFDLGYFKEGEQGEVVITDIFDKELFEAIKNFQKENELVVTGNLDKATRDLLIEMNQFLKENTQNEISNEFLDKELNYFTDSNDAVSSYKTGSSWLDYLPDFSFGIFGTKNTPKESSNSSKELEVVTPKHFIFRCFLDESCNSIK